MEFYKTSEPINIGILMKVESELDISFSEGFKKHYLRYNGGCPEKYVFLWNDSETTIINGFFSIKYKGFDNIESIYKNLVLEENYIPKKILPFAFDVGGNFFCVSFRDNDYDHIYYAEDGHYNVNHNEEHLTLATKSFEDLLKNLI